MSARRNNPALAWLVRSHPREMLQYLRPPLDIPPKDYASRLAILRQRLPDGFTCQRIQAELRWPLNPARDIVRDAKLAGDAVPVGGSAPADAIREAELARLCAQLEELRTGALTPAGFGSIRWVSFWLFEITATIRERSANDETTAWVREQRRQINGFVTAIATIGQRNEERGRYVASGDELRALDTMASMAAAILSIVTVGEYYAAALRADALDRELQRRQVRNWLADQVSALEKELA